MIPRLLASIFVLVPSLVLGDNPIQMENKHQGATDWQLTRVRLDAGQFRSTWIEGYCSKQSVKAGESIDIMVSTRPTRAFKLEIFRMGYYGGRGARLMKTIDRVESIEQTDPTIGEKNLHECKWKSNLTLDIPQDWISGVYLGRMTTIPEGNEAYWQSYVVFIVRDERPVDILFQCSDNTWQAYNVWPSKYSVYTHPIPKAIRGRGRMSVSIVPMAAKPNLRASSTIL